ncbi:MAG: polyphosphate kinase 2 family protein [Planctomycetes bacterium]|jgi:PPK2 family polyphosphate:nucleotide phosphotransferase|nr:polyphosphate kinase 2 family protein [Planctomycetota bacterium]
MFKDNHDFIKPYLVTKGRKFRLKDYDPKDTAHIDDKEHAQELLKQGVERLAKLQDKLYAHNHWSLLLIFQATDAAGKDGVIKHVMSGINPQGCQVYSFKKPSTEEMDHDFLWRTNKCLPERGRIGIFNRSYYEEVLVVKVHPEYLTHQHLPPQLIGKDVWEHRYESINDLEKHLARNGTVVRKFFLNVSHDEQLRRFKRRLEDPQRNWKYDPGDAAERLHWDEYQEAYQDCIRETASKHAPWVIVPADNKWFSRLVVASAVIDALESLDLHYPVVDAAKKKALAAAAKALDV